ncbi:MAG: hypothetical protein D6776_08575 [Planctomycetota bacterium]|nr:MAG: hypothetical protein D6776_08575 [Planctomycetota bacterium]
MAVETRTQSAGGRQAARALRPLLLAALGLALLAALGYAYRNRLVAEVSAWRLQHETSPARWIGAARALAAHDPDQRRAQALAPPARLRFLLATGRVAPPAPEPKSEAELARRVAQALGTALSREAEPVRLAREHPEIIRAALEQATEPDVVRRAALWAGAARLEPLFEPVLEALGRARGPQVAQTLFAAAVRLAASPEDRARVVERAYHHPSLRRRALVFAHEVGPAAVDTLARLREQIEQQQDPGAAYDLLVVVQRICNDESLPDDPTRWRERARALLQEAETAQPQRPQSEQAPVE